MSVEQFIRYALYYAPAQSTQLAAWGEHWLGRTALDERVPQPAVGIAAQRFLELTEEPRRYGLHATLKAPFRLRADVRYGDLAEQLEEFCHRRQPIVISPLHVRRISNFLAVVPASESTELRRLASDCTVQFDRFRAPLTESELARRLMVPLSVKQKDYLAQWGYPFVLDEFKFHMTLTGPLESKDERTISKLLQAAREGLEAIAGEATLVDSVCVFTQVSPDARFKLHQRFMFGGA